MYENRKNLINFEFPEGFMGDIAIPTLSNKPKQKDPVQEEVEKYKQEVLEGLQIEEEGLTDLVRKKTKQSFVLPTSRSYNDPFDNIPTIGSTDQKNTQILKQIDLAKRNLKTGNIDNYQTTSPNQKIKIRHRRGHLEDIRARKRKSNQADSMYAKFI